MAAGAPVPCEEEPQQHSGPADVPGSTDQQHGTLALVPEAVVGKQPRSPRLSCGASAAVAVPPPAEFVCPVCLALMRDPVVIPTGQTFERSYIEAWLTKQPSCPTTGQRLQRPVPIVPVYALRSAIEKWAHENAPWLLDEDGNVLPPCDQPGALETPLPPLAAAGRTMSATAAAAVPAAGSRPRTAPGGSGSSNTTAARRWEASQWTVVIAADAASGEQSSGEAPPPYYYPAPLGPSQGLPPISSERTTRLPHFSPAPLLPAHSCRGRGISRSTNNAASSSSSTSPTGRRDRGDAEASGARRSSVPRLSPAPLLLPVRSVPTAPSSPHPPGSPPVSRRQGGFTSPLPSPLGPAAHSGPSRPRPVSAVPQIAASAMDRGHRGQPDVLLGRAGRSRDVPGFRSSSSRGAIPVLPPAVVIVSGRHRDANGRSSPEEPQLPPAQLQRPRDIAGRGTAAADMGTAFLASSSGRGVSGAGLNTQAIREAAALHGLLVASAAVAGSTLAVTESMRALSSSSGGAEIRGTWTSGQTSIVAGAPLLLSCSMASGQRRQLQQRPASAAPGLAAGTRVQAERGVPALSPAPLLPAGVSMKKHSGCAIM
ncbi:hypothetical protein N2152v2_005607 [Parachlorella kessleri]